MNGRKLQSENPDDSGTHDDGYEEYVPLKPESAQPSRQASCVTYDTQSHSGDQIAEPVLEELRVTINKNGNGDIAISDEEDADDVGVTANVEVDIHHKDSEVGMDRDNNINEKVKAESGEDSYMKLFDNNNDDKVDLTTCMAQVADISAPSPGGTSYLQLFDEHDQPFDVVVMSSEDVVAIKDEIHEPDNNGINGGDDDIIDVVVVSQMDVDDAKDELKRSNEEVLIAMAGESSNEEEKPNMQMLLAWARSKSGKGKMPKTYSMKAREARKMESFKKAVDVGVRNIVIIEKEEPDNVVTLEEKAVHAGNKKPTSVQRSLSSVDSNSPITKEFIENVVISYEDAASVTLLSMNVDATSDLSSYITQAKCQLGGMGDVIQEKSYSWIIKGKSKKKGNPDNVADKNAFMQRDFGVMLRNFILDYIKASNEEEHLSGANKRRSQSSIKRAAALSLPFHPLIYSNAEYDVFDDLRLYRAASVTDNGQFDLNHGKLALKSLAKLHAISFAFFEKGQDDLDFRTNKFPNILDILVDKQFQQTLPECQGGVQEKLRSKFENLLKVVRATKDEEGGGNIVAEKLQKKFNGQRLFTPFKDALATHSPFSVVCHGFPALQKNSFKFLYDEETGLPVKAELVKFENARYASAVTDVQILLNTSLDSDIESQTDFLLRFVYHQTLVSTLRALNISFEQIVDVDELVKEFKRTQVFGRLAASMHIAGLVLPSSNRKTEVAKRKEPKTNVSYSKILGGPIGGEGISRNVANESGSKENGLALSIKVCNLVQKVL